jgi:membrane-associated phospholipid phosphatase
MKISNTATSIFALLAAGAAVPSEARAQNVKVTVGTPITISQSSANVLNLLAPYLSLNSTTVGQQTLTTNLSQAVATNNGASLALQQLGESDENLLNSPNPASNTLLNAPATGSNAFGIAANLGGGLPNQAIPAGGTVVPSQPVGGLGAVLGAAYVNGVGSSNVGTGSLGAVVTLLNNGYNNFTSLNLGVAKNYFADGGANSSVTYAADKKTATSATTFPAVAPAGFTLPTFNGLPNTTNSVYDLAYGVTNTQSGQDVFGSSRPVQVSTSINSFDPTALNQLAGNPSFPSGHTNYAYTDSILLAMLVPQEYQSMLYRASAYANSRIVVGVHYPLDIIVQQPGLRDERRRDGKHDERPQRDQSTGELRSGLSADHDISHERLCRGRLRRHHNRLCREHLEHRQ